MDSNGSVIDLLVVYTPAVQALYGTEGDDALIIQAVAETNQAYSNSNMATRLNLVGVYRDKLHRIRGYAHRPDQTKRNQ